MNVRKSQALMKTAVFAFVLTVSVLTGCAWKNNVTDEVKFPETLEQIESQTICSNDDFTLEWDCEKSCVLLKQKDSDKVWSTIPYDFYQGEETNEDLNSPISIEFVNSTNLIKEKMSGFKDCVSENRVSSQRIDNGIELIYYFDGVGISIPVQYSLRQDALEISVDFARVEEGETNKLLSVSVAPFLCSVANGSEDSYLVVPSGSGGLMYVDERVEGTRKWAGEIYGADPAQLMPEDLIEEETVRLPIFAAKSGSNAMMAIVEEGAEAAFITANAGDKTTGYSNVYVSFYSRGFDVSENSKGVRVPTDIYQMADKGKQTKSTVAFYPMSGTDADYMGVAKKYQSYLQEQGMLLEQTEEEAYALYFTGGAQIKELLLGIPVEKTRALTTFAQANTILKDLIDETEQTPAILLKGFGKTGLDTKEIAGGFSFASVFGKDKTRRELEEFCKENNVDMFTDFDIIHFQKSGNGYYTLTDAAGSALMRKIKLYPRDKALWNYNKDDGATFLLKRERLQSVVDELIEFSDDKEITGIGLSVLGKTAYSDYSKEQYNLRGHSTTDAMEFIQQFKTAGHKVSTSGANAYAAVVSDSVFDVPLDNGDFLSLDATIPLYQSVFKGHVSLYSTAINVQADDKETLALAISSGTSLGFSIIGTYDADFSNTNYTDLFASSYDGSKELLLETVSKTASYYDAIQGQGIVEYEFIIENVTRTEFSNGITVYVNHGTEPVSLPIGELGAYEFSYVAEDTE